MNTKAYTTEYMKINGIVIGRIEKVSDFVYRGFPTSSTTVIESKTPAQVKIKLRNHYLANNA